MKLHFKCEFNKTTHVYSTCIIFVGKNFKVKVCEVKSIHIAIDLLTIIGRF